MATMVLSKRWKFLWTFMLKLVYNDSCHQNPTYKTFLRFVVRSLFLHKAPVIETLHFKVGQFCDSGDIQVWIRAVHKRCVRELIIEVHSKSPVTLRKSLYTSCRMLVTLKLSKATLVDDESSLVSFPSLKNLSLISMKYPSDDFFTRLLSNCPVLVDLVVKRTCNDNVAIINIVVPSLKSLVLHESGDIIADKPHGFVKDAPSLELLDVYDTTSEVYVSRSNMPKIFKAKVVLSCDHPKDIMGSITSAKHLCLYVKFHELEVSEPRPSWMEPSSVPECLLSSLETVEWVRYKGTEEEKQALGFILRSGFCLKKVTINLEPTSNRMKVQMIKKLSCLHKLSPTCRIAFD